MLIPWEGDVLAVQSDRLVETRAGLRLNPHTLPAQPRPGTGRLARVDHLPCWTQREAMLRKHLESGETIVVNTEADLALVEWARQRDLFVPIEGQKEWGNWDSDGVSDPEEFLAAFVVYFALKKRLHGQIRDLKGKALGCRQVCAPSPADFLAMLAMGGTSTLEQLLQVAGKFTDRDLHRLEFWVQQRLQGR